ncbi:hypothetical protein PMAYCL1PPCAC_26936, partial [Pristionchus mayeri]
TSEMESIRNPKRALLPSSDPASVDVKRQRFAEMESNINKFENDPTIGEEDIISTLPDDCLISIMSHLNWDSVDIMDQISQRFHYISRNFDLKIPKKKMCTFAIRKTRDGHMVSVNPPGPADYCLIYVLSENGYSRKKILKRSYALFNMYDPRQLDGNTLPSNVFNALAQLYLRNTADHLDMHYCLLDDSSSKNIISAFQGKMPESLSMNGVTVHNDFDFSTFIADSIIRKLAVFPQCRVHNSFDEHFIQMFSLSDRPELNVYPQPKICKWTPSSECIPAICRYKHLRLDTLTLTRELLTELIMAAFLTANGKTYWMIGMDESVQVSDLGNFQTGMYSLDVRESNVSQLIVDIKKKESTHNCK